MPQVEVGLGNISEVDGGRIEAEFNAELRRAVKDCLERPGSTAARTVTLKVSVEPQGDPLLRGGALAEHAMLTFEVSSKVPAICGKAYQVKASGNGRIFTNPGSPEDVEQTTIDDFIDPKKNGANKP